VSVSIFGTESDAVRVDESEISRNWKDSTVRCRKSSFCTKKILCLTVNIDGGSRITAH
jgi:hypothetical protein